MKKPASLRRHLEASVNGLSKHPERLRVLIEQGSVATKFGAGLSFEWRYKLTLLFMDVNDSPDTLVVPMIAWLSVNQPDLLLNPDRREKALSFEAEALDNETMDIKFEIELSERVIVTKTATGYTCEHADEPPLADEDGVTPWTLYAGNDVYPEPQTP